jgi:hypothetical protein
MIVCRMSVDAHSSSMDDPMAAEGRPGSVPQARRARHLLGPMATIQPVEHPVYSRMYAAGVAAVALAVLMTAAWLRPDPSEAGTHRQLGLPPCGFYMMTGLPCPTCGMTTSFAYAVRGQVVHAVHAQAAGLALAAATAVAAVLGLFTAFTGKRVCVNWYRVNPTRLIWLVTLGFLLAWGLKIGLVLLNRHVPIG